MRSVLILLLILGLVACAPADTEGEDDAAAEPTVEKVLESGRHVYTTTDGVEMPYVVSGDGDRVVLLVHCWMCDRSFWDRQLPVLEPAFRVIAVDLPGHGEGGDGRAEWSVTGFGTDVAGLIAELDLNEVTLVGHSMGGPVSLRAAALAGGRVQGVIAVDTLQNAEFEFPEVMAQQMVEMFGADFRGTCNSMIGQMFTESEPPEVQEEVRRKGCEESNGEAGNALIRDFLEIDLKVLFQEAGVPIRGINAVNPQNPTQIETNRKYADFDAVEMEDVGHYLHMTRPEEFNGHLLAALDALGG